MPGINFTPQSLQQPTKSLYRPVPHVPQGNRGNNTNPNAGGGGSGETVTTSPGRRKILATPPKGYSDVATRTLAGPYLDGEDRCGRQQERAGANGATTSRLSSIENLSIATDNLQSSKPAEFESCGSPFVWNDGVADGKAQEYADNAPPSPSNVWMPRTAFHGGDTGVRRRISPRAGHRTAGTVGGGWAPVSPPQNEALYEGQEQGKERPPSLSEMGLPEDDQAQVDIGEPRICVEEVGDGKRSTGCSFRFAGQQHGTASDDACASSGLNAYPDVATPKRGTDRAQAAMKAGTTAAAAVASTAAVCVATDQPPDRSVGLRCSSPIYDRERNLLGNVQGRRGGGGGLGSETATKLIQGKCRLYLIYAALLLGFWKSRTRQIAEGRNACVVTSSRQGLDMRTSLFWSSCGICVLNFDRTHGDTFRRRCLCYAYCLSESFQFS